MDSTTLDDARQLIRLAVREDLRKGMDWTTVSLVDLERRGAADVVARVPGIVCGVELTGVVIDETNADLQWNAHCCDGDAIEPGRAIGRLSGSARDLLTVERLILNLFGKLSGVATKTREYVEVVAGTKAAIYDTRKTTPGYRRLEKHAVACGGGCNHRDGLYAGVLIKDNHLALAGEGSKLPVADSVARARQFLQRWNADPDHRVDAPSSIEVEVDSLDQLREVLPVGPDIVLLDNMPPAVLKEAVAMRNQLAPAVILEASGGIDLTTLRSVAETGVDRISCGALTHSAANLDIGLDWVQ